MTEQADNEVDALIDGMCGLLRQKLQLSQIDDPMIVGIQTGGAWVAERIHAALGNPTPLSTLNISFYRDDFSRIGLNPTVKPSAMTCPVENRHVVLVDDVLYTGRTVRAALNELFDFGRPASVTLAVLVDRGGRELPVQADIVGKSMTLSGEQQIKLVGPNPLRLELQSP
ncbi:MAG: bifunctional pyr operon transcriptional regulator/uracil phosphoribosyltransferase PyrR [Gammaproteobacteria bacterium]